MRFLVEFAPAGLPAWWLVDDGERVIAWSGTTFDSLAIADQAAHSFRVESDGREYRMHSGDGDTWRWTAWDGAGERVAVSGRWFGSEAEARHSALGVDDLAGAAIGP